MSSAGAALPMPRSRRGVSFIGLAMAAAVFALATVAPVAVAEEGYTYDLARDMMSPYCPGRTLAACPSPQAADLIEKIQEQERAGVTREEMEAQLYARFGDVMRGAPKPEGWGLAAYVIPVLAAFAGVAVVVLVLRRISSSSAPRESAAMPIGTPPVSTDDEIERLVDREIEQLG